MAVGAPEAQADLRQRPLVYLTIDMARPLAMLKTSFRRIAGFAGMAALTLAFCPAWGAAGIPDIAVAAGPTGRVCGISTPSIRQLAVIENSAEDSFQCLGLAMDGETVRAIRLETHRFTPGSARPDDAHVDVTAFLPEVVGSHHGAVLDGVPGHDAIILHGALVGQPDRLQLMISYLYNGFTGEYRSCQVTLDRAPDPSWHLVTHTGLTISRIVVKTRQMPVIGAFGIASLDGACS